MDSDKAYDEIYKAWIDRYGQVPTAAEQTQAVDTYKDYMAQAAKYDQYSALKRQFEIQLANHQQAQAQARRRLTKRELMAGILEEIKAMRERLDTLTATLATEALTGDEETEMGPQTAGTVYTQNVPANWTNSITLAPPGGLKIGDQLVGSPYDASQGGAKLLKGKVP